MIGRCESGVFSFHHAWINIIGQSLYSIQSSRARMLKLAKHYVSTHVVWKPYLTRNFAIFNMQPVILDQSNANPLRFMFRTNCSLERTLKWMLNNLFDLCEGWMGLSSRSKYGTGVNIWMFQASSPFGACSSQQATSAKPGGWCAIFCGHVGYWQVRLSYKRTLDLRIQRTDHRWKAEKYRWSLNTFEEVTCPTNIQQLYLFDRNPFFPTASILMFWNAQLKVDSASFENCCSIPSSEKSILLSNLPEPCEVGWWDMLESYPTSSCSVSQQMSVPLCILLYYIIYSYSTFIILHPMLATHSWPK